MFDGEPSRALEKLAGTGQRGVCGAVWGNNDIAYRCRTCLKWADLYETTLHVVEDIRFVMSHSLAPRYVTHDRRNILRTWMKQLAFVQGMNPQ
ncbi:hypothetical protein CQW23_07138 [Capsicum baccatum]|uniref:E3 ubiquitin-protein ligase n=1 Tax=Capsicum baccatum TaxID=33114 RepID=A0A2G2X5C1_CAPBA|nr:hypothetical protein CQW23_07138 [Capsicum baccatum]